MKALWSTSPITPKARQATNQESQVTRYLCHEDAALLAKYLVYVRPFTDMLYRKYHGHEQDRRLLFAAPDTPERPWKADVLTRALKTLTYGVCGTAFGVQVYLQLSVAVTERHIEEICRPFNHYDDKSTNADIEVAFAWQSDHRPIQRETRYGIDAAYPDSLQPALLRVYQWAFCEWHRFLKLDRSFDSEVSTDVLRSREPQQQESTPGKRSFQDNEDSPEPKRAQVSFQSRLISPPPRNTIHHSRSRNTSLFNNSGLINQLLRSDKETQGVGNPNDHTETTDGGDEADSGLPQSPISSMSVQSDLRSSWPLDVASDIDSDLVPSESDEAGQSRTESVRAEVCGFCGLFLDFGDLICCAALEIKQ